VNQAERYDNLRGTSALIRAGRGLGTDEDEPPMSPHAGGLFVTGAHVLRRLGDLEAKAHILSSDVESFAADGTHPTIAKAWAAWHAAWLERAQAIRKRGQARLSFSAADIMGELDKDEVTLGRWRATLTAQGGTSSEPAPPSISVAGDAAPAPRFKSFDLKTLLKWAAILTGIFAFGHLFRAFGEASHGASNFVDALRGGRKKAEGSPEEPKPTLSSVSSVSSVPGPKRTLPMSVVEERFFGAGAVPVHEPRPHVEPRFELRPEEWQSPPRRMAASPAWGQRSLQDSYGGDYGAPVVTRPSPIVRPKLAAPPGGWSLVLAPKQSLGRVEQTLGSEEWFVVDDETG
jgi:hypothetical protein